MSLSALRWPKVEEIEEMQKRSCSRWRRGAGSEGKVEKRVETGLVRLTSLTASSVRRKRARLLWW